MQPIIKQTTLHICWYFNATYALFLKQTFVFIIEWKGLRCPVAPLVEVCNRGVSILSWLMRGINRKNRKRASAQLVSINKSFGLDLKEMLLFLHTAWSLIHSQKLSPTNAAFVFVFVNFARTCCYKRSFFIILYAFLHMVPQTDRKFLVCAFNLFFILHLKFPWKDIQALLMLKLILLVTEFKWCSSQMMEKLCGYVCFTCPNQEWW